MSDSYIPDDEPRYILLSLEELASKKLPHAPTFRKAADEITRLRAENERLREALIETLAIARRNEAGDYVDRARAAIGGVTEKKNG